MDKNEFFGNFHTFYFIFAELTCLRFSKSVMSTPTAVLLPFSALTNLLLVGKWFSDGLFGDLHRQLLFTSLTFLHRPPLN